MTGEPRTGGSADVDAVGDPGGDGARGGPAGARREVPPLAGPPAGVPSTPPPPPGGGAGGTPLPDPEARDDPEPGSSGGGSFLRELPVLVVIALLLALLIKAFLVQAFFIPSGSMEQTLQIGDRVLVNKLVYRFRDIRRGEIVVFDGRTSSFQPEIVLPDPSNPVERVVRGVQGALGLGATGERDFIKRVVGLPGDTVFCCDERGRVSVNEQVLDEPYLYDDDQRPFGPVTVPEGRVFVLGDHRGASQDSRAYLANPDVGTVAVDRVIGRAFVVVWPIGHAKVLERPDTFDDVAAAAAAAASGTVAVPTGAVAVPGAVATPTGALAAVPLVLGATAAVPLHLGARRLARAARRSRDRH